jgi:hypothetical protein
MARSIASSCGCRVRTERFGRRRPSGGDGKLALLQDKNRGSCHGGFARRWGVEGNQGEVASSPIRARIGELRW